MSILLTGFDPFDGANVNPSWEAVRRAPETVCGHEVHRLQLPTVFGRAAALLKAEIARVQPEVVICCGVAGGRAGITPELVAINYRQARIPDNEGQQFMGTPIDPAGDTAYMTALPVNAMVDAMKAAGIPSYLSLSAGAYVCNDVYYALLQSQSELGHRGLFVHVPNADVVGADAAAQAIVLCLETALGETGGFHAGC